MENAVKDFPGLNPRGTVCVQEMLDRMNGLHHPAWALIAHRQRGFGCGGQAIKPG